MLRRVPRYGVDGRLQNLPPGRLVYPDDHDLRPLGDVPLGEEVVVETVFQGHPEDRLHQVRERNQDEKRSQPPQHNDQPGA